MNSLFRWWHTRVRGRALLADTAVGKHREASRTLIHMLFQRGPLLGMTRIVHEFNDYHVADRRPVGTWRITVERISPPPGDGIVKNFEQRTRS